MIAATEILLRVSVCAQVISQFADGKMGTIDLVQPILALTHDATCPHQTQRGAFMHCLCSHFKTYATYIPAQGTKISEQVFWQNTTAQQMSFALRLSILLEDQMDGWGGIRD